MNANRIVPVVVLAAAVCFLGGRAWAGYDEIHMGAMWGDTAKVEQLLDQGADVNARDSEGATPLFYAAGHGQKAVAELLLAKGADVNAKSSDGNTSLHNAARGGSGWGKSDTGDYKAVVELLLDRGADVNARDNRGFTPLYLAIQVEGNQEIIELLRQHGGVE